MVGRALTDDLYHSHGEDTVRRPGRKILSVQNLSMSRVVKNTSFSVYGGQVIGMFGLIGSGRAEAAMDGKHCGTW